MAFLLHHLIRDSANSRPEAPALLFRDKVVSYADLWGQVKKQAEALQKTGLQANQRVAIYLPKTPEAVIYTFAATLAQAVFVPINPALKAAQVEHILGDCDAAWLVTTRARADLLAEALQNNPHLQLWLVDPPAGDTPAGPQIHRASQTSAQGDVSAQRVDADMAAILYTSGSTGFPKGVVLTHGNLLAGARSVASYLSNASSDRILAILPLSFDYGLSQVTSAFQVGAAVILLDYLLPRDVIRAVTRYAVTGVAAVPALWNQLATLDWPPQARQSLRYITNSGGAMPVSTTRKLRAELPATQIFLMYGLTEAFRSTYLDPAETDKRPESIGKPIPNAEVLVVRPDGSACSANETGEFVHRGALVAKGYWNDPEKTKRRFRPAPGQPEELPNAEIAVWSGDYGYRDKQGFLYFVGRQDEMIKISGYRVSPTEIEAATLDVSGVEQAVALGIPHPTQGQGIVLLIQGDCAAETIARHCQQQLPQYMMPAHIEVREALPVTPNDKIDRQKLRQEYLGQFQP